MITVVPESSHGKHTIPVGLLEEGLVYLVWEDWC